MTDLEYMDRAEQLLLAVEQCCDHINDTTDADVDSQRTGGMITLTFPNGTQIIINQQKPLHEIWMATSLTASSGKTAKARASFLLASAAMPQHKQAWRLCLQHDGHDLIAEQVENAAALLWRWRLLRHHGRIGRCPVL